MHSVKLAKYNLYQASKMGQQIYVTGPLIKVYFFIFLLLFSHLRLSQSMDDPVVGWLNHFFVITLSQQQPNGSMQT